MLVALIKANSEAITMPRTMTITMLREKGEMRPAALTLARGESTLRQ